METTRLKRSENYTNLSKNWDNIAHHHDTRFHEYIREEIYEIDELQQGQQEGSKQSKDVDKENIDEEASNNVKMVAILRELLAVERSKNQCRKENSASIQRYVKQLQDDYLALQREMLGILEAAHKLNAQKDAQLETLNETLREREQLIERLKVQLDTLEPSKVKQEFEELSRKQSELANLERQQLLDQIASIEQQLVRERVANSQILQQFQERLERETQRHESETSTLIDKISELENELTKMLGEPKTLLIRTLKEERVQLQLRVDDLGQAVSESQARYESLREQAHGLVREQELIEKNNRVELERLGKELTQQRATQQDLKLKLQDKEEIIQVLQFNVHRSEKRSKCLLHSIRSSELAYKEALGQLEIKHEQVVKKAGAKAHNLERRLIDVQDELDQRQNELVRTRLEQEAQLDALRNDRDDRLSRLSEEKQRCEKNLQASQLKLAVLINLQEQRDKQFEELQKDLDLVQDQAKKLSMELILSDAKLFSRQEII